MFDDIRPFRNNEVVQVIDDLINEKEFQSSVATVAMPKLYKLFPGICRFLVKNYLKYQQKHVDSIEKIQLEVYKYLSKLVKNSTDGFTHSGLHALDKSKPSLFISNHRDIVLDVALVNLALHEENRSTVEAAVGDNLLSKKWVADLMRINKSFIVKRSEKTKRAALTASKQLSAYIHHTITQNMHDVWIAQKEGRAKDGLDKTNPALISMILMNKAKDKSIEQYLSEINIVPVSISYEFDPCDKDKAIELATIEQTGSYQKEEEEDLNSISRGILGYKGKVHIAFSAPISGNYSDSKAIAEQIDKQIISNYKLYQSNLTANEALKKDILDENDFTALSARMETLTALEKKWLLTMYANPVIAKENINNHEQYQ